MTVTAPVLIARIHGVAAPAGGAAGEGSMASWAGPAVDGSLISSGAAHSSMRGRQHGVHGCGGDADRVQDSHVRKDAARAECVDGRVGYAEQLGDFADR